MLDGIQLTGFLLDRPDGRKHNGVPKIIWAYESEDTHRVDYFIIQSSATTFFLGWTRKAQCLKFYGQDVSMGWSDGYSVTGFL
jgi:hypothetical protein